MQRHRPAVPSPASPRVALLAGAVGVLLLLGLVLPGRARAEGETKVLDARNFKWTIPEGWSFEEEGAGAREGGYVIKAVARKDDAYVIAHVRVVPTNGLPLEDLSEEMREYWSNEITSLTGSKVRKGTLSGLPGTEVIVKGEDETGNDLMIRVWSIQAKDSFHQLIFKFYNGAETTMAAQADAARRGYRLLEGAGPMEPEADVGDMGAKDDDLEKGRPDHWPEKGPERKGQTIVFAHHNVSWTLPEKGPFQITGIVGDESEIPKTGLGLLLGLRAQESRKAKRKDEPTDNRADIRFLSGPAAPGFDPDVFVENPGVQNNVAEQFFDQLDFARTKAYTGVDIGNVKGAVLRMAGRKGNRARFFWLYVVGLKGMRYQWQIDVSGGREANGVFKTAIRDVMKGLSFPDTTEWAKGPLAIPGVPAFNLQREKDEAALKKADAAQAKQKKITSVGFTIVKPAGMRPIALDPEHSNPNMRLAWETRSEDKSLYFYFDIHTFPLTGRERNPIEEILTKRTSQWKERAESPETIKKGKSPGFKDSFGKAKGLGYEFKGTLGNAPYTERGYIVRFKKYLYWIRFQYGGEKAEKRFSKLARAIKKSLKI